MLRSFRSSDLPAYFRLMVSEFPKETPLLGWRYEPFARIVRRLERWDFRFVLGLMRLIGRPVFQVWVLEQDGTLAASAIESFGPVSAYVASVVVAPAYPRRGFAKRILSACHETARRSKKKFVVLDVLDDNAGAIALYDSLGYRPVGHASHFVRQSSTPPPEPPASVQRRAFEAKDGAAIAEIVGSFLPDSRSEVQPVRASDFALAPALVRALDSQTSSWVVDPGGGVIAWVRATVSPAMEAGHISAPVVGENVDASELRGLLDTAVRWALANGAVRLLAEVVDENARGAEALRNAGFEITYGSRTLAWSTQNS